MRHALTCFGTLLFAISALLFVSSVSWADGLSTTPNWVYTFDQEISGFATSLDGAGDVNGDGYADIIIAVPYYEWGRHSTIGAAFAFYGGTSGPGATPDWRVVGIEEGLWTGCSVAGAGDVNDDGYDDVIVRAFLGDFETSGGRGVAIVYLGGPYGLSLTKAWMNEGNISKASGAGDVNNDGYDDIILGDPMYDIPDQLGYEGRAYVYYGGPSGISPTPPWIKDGNGYFGVSVAGAGDVNNDGYDDIIVGESRFYDGSLYAGRAHVFLGGSDGVQENPAWTFGSQDQLSDFGAYVAGAGDVNDDGYNDVLVGEPWFFGGGVLCANPTAGSAYLFYGGADGPDKTEPVIFEEPYFGCNSIGFGSGVAGAGDVNDDGISDIALAWWATDHAGFKRGSAFVLYGMSAGLTFAPDWVYESGENLSNSIAGVGDVNGDGVDDFLVGNTEYDSESAKNVGAAMLFYGSPDEATNAEDPPAPAAPVSLYQNHPNPFNPVTTIRFELPSASMVRVDVYDLQGKHVATAARGVFPSGISSVVWPGTNTSGEIVASGVYFYRLFTEHSTLTKRMVFLK